MNILRFATSLLILVSGMALCQSYPNKPIRFVTVEAGGGTDFATRVIALGLNSSLGQQVVVENRGGASGIIAAQTVTKSPPDGYTLFLTSGTAWLLPFLQDKVPYDPIKDFSPIIWSNSAPNILVVHPSLPVKSVKELIALAKARPGELNYASGSTGAAVHLSAELFKAMARVNIVRVAYRGSAPAVTAMISGEVQVQFGVAASVTPHVKTGKLRALAVTSAQRSELGPGLPTVSESGLPGYDSIAIWGVFAPAKTPDAIINRLNQEISRIITSAEAKSKFFNVGMETAGGSPEEFAATIKSDMSKWGAIIKDAGIRAD